MKKFAKNILGAGTSGEASRRPSKAEKGKGRTLEQDPLVEAAHEEEAAPKHKIFIEERSVPPILPGESVSTFRRTIYNKKWVDFCNVRPPAVKQVVREFYAAVAQQTEGQIRVRGKQVHFNASTINSMFKLPIPLRDEYAEFANSAFTDSKAELVRITLTDGNGTWATHYGEYVYIQKKNFNAQAKAWFYLISALIFPVTHYSNCRKDTAILIHAIMTGMTINIGELLHIGILRSANPSKGYWFPSMITMLCRKAKVRMANNEETLPTGIVMDEAYIQRLDTGSRFTHTSSSRISKDRRRAITRGERTEPEHYIPRLEGSARHEQPPSGTAQDASTMQRILDNQIQYHQEYQRDYQELCSRYTHMERNLKQIDDTLHFFGTSAGYDMSGYPSIVPWPGYADATQAGASMPQNEDPVVEENEEDDEDDENEENEEDEEDDANEDNEEDEDDDEDDED